MVDLGSLEGLAGNLLNIAVMLIVVLVLGGIIVALYMFYLKRKKYREFKCIIWEINKKGDIVNETYDSGGIFVDKKTNNKRLYIKKANVGLSPDNVPYIQGTRGTKVVYLLRTGLKNFRPITPPRIEGSAAFEVGEEDVNWAINAYESQKKTFSSSMLLQYMPYILLGFVCMVIMIIFIYFFKNFEVLKDVAVAFRDAASVLAQSRAGTVVS